MEDKIYIDGSFNGHYLSTGGHGSKNKRTICDTHKKSQLGYREWHTYAQLNEAKGVHQKQCQKCLRWFYPDEF